MRPADYVGHAWRGAVRQPVRTGLTVVSLAIGAQMNTLPMTPETIWKKSQETAT